VSARSGRVFLIGYGNPLRGDDGIGWRVAELAAADPRLAGVRVLTRHQLTPELAVDLSQADLAVLVDARVGPEPAGTIRTEWLDDATAGVAPAGSLTHHVDPAQVAALAERLYGARPRVAVVSVTVARLDAGDTLSSQVAAAVPAVLDTITGLVTQMER
jgi:hydrogenase maturation protease